MSSSSRAFASLMALMTVAPFVLPGCARARATATPSRPPLEVPAPPPRDVEAIDTAEVPPPVPLIEEPARRTQVPRSRTPAPAATAPRTEPAKPETPKPADAAPAEAAKPIEEPPKPPAPVGTLQTAPAETEGKVEAEVRAELQRASGDLNRINVRALNSDARTQYDAAKRFVSQAQEALRAKNVMFAKNLADKAAALAAQLAGR